MHYYWTLILTLALPDPTLLLRIHHLIHHYHFMNFLSTKTLSHCSVFRIHLHRKAFISCFHHSPTLNRSEKLEEANQYLVLADNLDKAEIIMTLTNP